MSRETELYSRWASEMRRAGFFRAGDRVGVAVSGGPDSVLLLEFMGRLARKMGLQLSVVHFNHHLRGAESGEDEQFVRELARQRELDFLLNEANTAEVARQARRNLEATARDLRYRFFFALVTQGRLEKVVTAHTANDQAETVLLRLLRGAGTRGLAGIYPVLEGRVVRPFLNVARAEIESELRARKLAFRVDSSNRDSKFLRNKIRIELLPQLEKHFNPRVIKLLKEVADRARDDESYLEQQARERAQPWRVREGGEERIPIRPLLEFPAAIARRVLRQMIISVRNEPGGVSHARLEALRRLASQAQSGRTIELQGGGVARKEFDWLVIAPEARPQVEESFSYSVRVPGEVAVPELGLTFCFDLVGVERGRRRAYNYIKRAGVDPLKLSGELLLRNWRAGDRFRPMGSRRSWKLKELFQRHKIPLGQRKLWPVLESGKEIVWVRGFPPAGAVALSPASKKVMTIAEQATHQTRS